jgi:hypothetical protein
LRAWIAVFQHRSAEIAFLGDWRGECPLNKLFVEEWESSFFAPIRNDSVVSAEVAFSESANVKVQLFDEALVSMAVVRCCMSGVTSKQLVSTEAGEQDSSVGVVWLVLESWTCTHHARTASGEVQCASYAQIHLGVVRMHECDDPFLMLHGLRVRHVDGHEAPLSFWTDLAEFGVRSTACDAIGTRFERCFEGVGVGVRRLVYARVLEGDVE